MKKNYLYIKYEKEYLEICELVKSKPLANEDMYSIGLFLLALINRAMVTSKGIETLLRTENYESALPLLRVLMDCGLQIKAATMAENKREYYQSFGDIKAKKGKKPIGEGDIARSLDTDEWTTGAYQLYKFLCKYIHLSTHHAKLLWNADTGISIGKLNMKENKEIAAQIVLCYDDVSSVVLDILRYYIEDLWDQPPGTDVTI